MKKSVNKVRYKGLMLGSVGLACIIGGLYAAGCWYFKTHFYPHTSADGISIELMTGSGAAQAVKKLLNQKRVLEFSGKDRFEQIDVDKIRLLMEDATDYKRLLSEQDSYKWFLNLFQNHDVSLSLNVSYDDSLLKQEIHQLDMVSGTDVKAPEPAKLEYQDNKGFIIVPETDGTQLDEDKVFISAGKSLLNADVISAKISVDLSDAYVQPFAKSDDPALLAEYKAVQNIGKHQLVMDFTDDVLNLDMNRLISMLVMKDNKPDLDAMMLKQYVLDLAKQENTIHDMRSFTTYDGDIAEVQSDRDSYGFVLDQDKTADVIRNAFLSGSSDRLTAVWNTGYGVPKTRHTKQGDIGNTYAEVSIDEQHMWYYEDGQCVFDCDVVTGRDGGRNTPTGVYFIWNKESPSMLRGSYGSQKVSYWMAATWDGCGFHDASWRSSFGGTIWKTNGSHGCINMPPDKAAELYQMIDYNTPVVIYERTGQ